MDRRRLNNSFVRLMLLSLICISIFGNIVCKPSDSLTKQWDSYSFVDPEGQLLPKEFWRTKKTVVYFGFSHCPDMCPLALTNFGRTSLILGEKSKKYQFVFITLDPSRDSPNVMKNYVKTFPGKNLVALSPLGDTLTRLTEALGVVSNKVGDGTNYRIDHSNFIYVFDENGKSIANFLGGISANALATKLSEL